MNPSYLLPTADIQWSEGNPFAVEHDDIYWHRDTPLQEKHFVFIEPLARLLQQASVNAQITVAELGFGFANNCLLAADLWQDAPAESRLNLVSIEHRPVIKEELSKYLADKPFRCKQALLDQYPPPIRGQHVIWLAANVRLLLIFEEAETALSHLEADVDLWLLDGFAPAKNPEMWQASLIRKLFARSRPGAQVATYSAAGQVRRDLEANGFTVNRISGFGRKKEMLQAQRPGSWQPKTQAQTSTAVIGAGLAGLYCAEALLRRGQPVRLLDRGTPGPSMISQLAVYPQLSAVAESRYRFSLLAHQYMTQSYGYQHAPMQWIPRDNDETTRLSALSEVLPHLVRQIDTEEFELMQVGWLSADELKSKLESDSRLRVEPLDVTDMQSTDDGWHLKSAQHDVHTERVIVAAGYAPGLLPDELEIRAIRGLAISVPTEERNTILNGPITIFPTFNGRSIISGTYARSKTLDVAPKEVEELLNAAEPYLGPQTDLRYHVGIRATSIDRLPIVGASPDFESTVRDPKRYPEVPGLHFCTAFGSRGATHARLCAEHLISRLLGEPNALDRDHHKMLSPARFYIRGSNERD